MSKKNVSVSVENQKYINAFIEVANILEPNVEFNDVVFQKHTNESDVYVEIKVSGFTYIGGIKYYVEVTKELRNPLVGEEIVVRHIAAKTKILAKERGIWAFSFNWKGLINTCNVK